MSPFPPASATRSISRRAFLAAIATGLSGCAGWLPFKRDSFAPPLTATTSTDDLIGRLNANIERLAAWKSTSVGIRARTGLPMQLSAVIAVEAPRNFRLRVSSIGGDEADFGSNAERFWFWIRRNEPRHVFTARHEDLPKCQQKLQLPFQPDWLMEVLGVVPLDAEQFTQEHQDPRTGTVTLAAERLSPTGQPVRRVLVVDVPRGHILGHHLYDATVKLIAKAGLRNHRHHPKAGVTLPHTIDLDWPQAGMAMTMTVGRDVEINPQAMPDQMWQVPAMPGYPPFDLGR